MTITFYPHQDDLESASMAQKLELLMDAAERYKAVVLDAAAKSPAEKNENGKRMVPRELTVAYNWDEIAKALREIRELPESGQAAKITKANHLAKLAEIYEILRAAKMAKLEAVRLALMNEVTQLRSSSQVA